MPNKKRSHVSKEEASYQRRTFSRRILFDPRVKRRSTRHIHEGRNEFSPGTKRGSHNLLLFIFLVHYFHSFDPPPPSSTLHPRDNTCVAQERGEIVADRDQIVSETLEMNISRAISRDLRPHFGYFIGVFRIDLVGGRFGTMKFVCKSWDGGEYSTTRYEEFIGTKLGIIKSRIEFLKQRINVLLH